MSHERADKWINAATAMKLVAIASNAYWMATFFNYAIKQDENEDAAGLSRYAITFGLLIGAFSIIGFIFSHRALYKNSSQTQPGDIQGDVTEGFLEGRKLTKKERIYLAGNFLTCATDVAGPLGLVLKIAASELNLFRNAFLGADAGFLAAGMFCAVAETRACKNAMTGNQNPPPDKWTVLSAIGEASGVVSDVYFWTRLFGLITGRGEDFLGLSYYALPFGILIGLLATAGETYSHWKVNTYSGTSDNVSENDNRRLPPLSKLALAGNFIAQAAEFAALVTFVIRLAIHKNPLTTYQEILLNIGLILIGSLGAVADTRKGYQSMEKDIDDGSRLTTAVNSPRSESAIENPTGVAVRNIHALNASPTNSPPPEEEEVRSGLVICCC